MAIANTQILHPNSQGDCFTMEVSVIADNINFAAKDFSWTFGAGQSAVDLTDSRISLNGGGKIVKVGLQYKPLTYKAL